MRVGKDMTPEDKRKLGTLIALYDLCKNALENYKPMIRELANEDMLDFNRNSFFDISRCKYTSTTYPEEYNKELKALKEKYKDATITETTENYTIKYNATSYSIENAQIIFNDIMKSTQTELKKLSASTTAKTKNSTKRG